MTIQKPLTYRLQIEMDAKQHAAMIELMEVCGFTTKREMINNFITLGEWVKDKLLEGREITSYHPVDKSVVELRMPFFSNIVQTRNAVETEQPKKTSTFLPHEKEELAGHGV